MIKLACFFCYLKFLYSKTNLEISSHLCSIMPGRINFMVSTTREGKIIILHIISPQKKIYISYHDREWKPHSLALPKLSQSFITRAVLSNTVTDENQCPVYKQKYIVLQCFFCFRLVPNGSGLQVDDEAQIHDMSHICQCISFPPLKLVYW